MNLQGVRGHQFYNYTTSICGLLSYLLNLQVKSCTYPNSHLTKLCRTIICGTLCPVTKLGMLSNSPILSNDMRDAGVDDENMNYEN